MQTRKMPPIRKGQCGSLTDRSGRIPKEHGQQIHLLSCFAAASGVAPDTVSTRCAAAGAAKLDHMTGKEIKRKHLPASAGS